MKYAMGDGRALRRAEAITSSHGGTRSFHGNAAMQSGAHPATWTYSNIDTMRRQLKSMGLSLDWSREIATCNPVAHKHQQRMFSSRSERGRL